MFICIWQPQENPTFLLPYCHWRPLVGEGPVKAAIEVKHRSSTSEQLNGCTIIAAVDILVWSLNIRTQKGEAEGDQDWEQALFPHWQFSSEACSAAWLPQNPRQVPRGPQMKVGISTSHRKAPSDNHRRSFSCLVLTAETPPSRSRRVRAQTGFC